MANHRQIMVRKSTIEALKEVKKKESWRSLDQAITSLVRTLYPDIFTECYQKPELKKFLEKTGIQLEAFPLQSESEPST